jgi:hypothetical protein
MQDEPMSACAHERLNCFPQNWQLIPLALTVQKCLVLEQHCSFMSRWTCAHEQLWAHAHLLVSPFTYGCLQTKNPQWTVYLMTVLWRCSQRAGIPIVFPLTGSCFHLPDITSLLFFIRLHVCNLEPYSPYNNNSTYDLNPLWLFGDRVYFYASLKSMLTLLNFSLSYIHSSHL